MAPPKIESFVEKIVATNIPRAITRHQLLATPRRVHRVLHSPGLELVAEPGRMDAVVNQARSADQAKQRLAHNANVELTRPKATSNIFVARKKTEVSVGRVSLNHKLVTSVQDSIRVPRCDKLLARMWMLGFLFLGESHDRADDRAVNEQTNVGLIAALLLTITLPYQLATQDMDWSMIEGMYGEGAVQFHTDALTYLALMSTLCMFLSVVHAALTIMYVGVCDSDYESYQLSQLLGIRMSAGFILFIFGAVFMAGFLVYHYILFSFSWWKTILGLASIGVSVMGYIFLAAVPQQQGLYQVKMTAYQNEPTMLTNEDIESISAAFCQEIGAEWMNPEILVKYAELYIREQRGCMRASNRADQEQPVVLSDMSIKILSALADKVAEKHVENCLGEISLLKILSNAPEGRPMSASMATTVQTFKRRATNSSANV